MTCTTRRPNLLVSALLAVSCQGSIAPDRPDDAPQRADLDDDDIAAGGAGGGPAPVPNASGAVPRLPPRRLTRYEYAATVRDLLGLDLPANTSFVPDEVLGFWENDAATLTTSPVLVEQTHTASADLARRAVADLPRLLSCATKADDACARAFVRDFGLRAFRRPLDDAEARALDELFAAGSQDGGFAGGVELALRTMLMAPQFLFRAEVGRVTTDGSRRPTSWEMASRLSYTLWGSMPDEALFDAARRGALESTSQIEAQARRLLEDRRSRRALLQTLRQWLDLDAMTVIEKRPDVFPTWSADLPGFYRAEVDAYLEEAFFGTPGTLAALFTSTRTRGGSRLARIYGVPAPAGDEPVSLDLPGKERAGLLTLAGILAQHASDDDTSPTLRGAFVRRRILCGELPPPPPNVNNQLPPPSPASTTRERVAQHATNPACAECHALMDPIGFGFERYDGLGRFRVEQNGKPIDATGEVTKSAIGHFDGAVDLARKLAAAPETSRCLAQQLLTHALGRAVDSDAEPDFSRLVAIARTEEAGALERLLVAVTQTPAFLHVERGGRP